MLCLRSTTSYQREDKNGGTNEQQTSDPTQVRETRQEQAQESRGKNANQEASQEVTKLEVSQDDGALLKTVGALGGDLGVVEPDDDPLSCLADEEGDAGGGNGGRPPMRLLVAPVDPKLAVRVLVRDLLAYLTINRVTANTICSKLEYSTEAKWNENNDKFNGTASPTIYHPAL